MGSRSKGNRDTGDEIKACESEHSSLQDPGRASQCTTRRKSRQVVRRKHKETPERVQEVGHEPQMKRSQWVSSLKPTIGTFQNCHDLKRHWREGNRSPLKEQLVPCSHSPRCWEMEVVSIPGGNNFHLKQQPHQRNKQLAGRN